jgi:hypothetical protein
MNKTALFVILAMLACGSVAFGSIAACSTTATGTPLSNADYAGAGLGNGCASVNLSFENFGFLSGSHTGSGVTQSTSNNAVFSTGTGASGDSVGPVTITFDPTTAANWVLTSNGTTGATISYVAIAHTGGSYTGGSYGSPATPGYFWDFSTLTFNVSGQLAANNANSSGSVTQTICVGATSVSGCASANLATITATLTDTAVTFSCSVGAGFAWGACLSATSNVLNFSTHPTMIALQDVYTLSRTGNNDVTLSSFGTTFGEVADSPEPATITLTSGALLGLAFCAVRKRRNR